MSEGAFLLREAWGATTGNAAADRLLHRSLAASAGRSPELLPVLRELELGGRTQLDLHLEGAREGRHETSASALGDFLKRVSKAVRETAKSVAGSVQLRGDLSVLAPAAGSVRVVFVEQDEPVLEDAGGSKKDSWSKGMERVASTFELANEGRDSLDASVQDLNAQAREALRMLAQSVEENEWGIAGSLTTRNGETRPIALSVSAARRLADSIQFVPVKVPPISQSGSVDAWKWSSSTMRLAPMKGAAIEAHVPEDLQKTVAAYNADPTSHVDATFDVTERISPRSSTGRIIRSYTLRSIRPTRTLFDD